MRFNFLSICCGGSSDSTSDTETAGGSFTARPDNDDPIGGLSALERRMNGGFLKNLRIEGLTSRRERAARTIQRIWRGGVQRQENAELAFQVPYITPFAFCAATNSYALKFRAGQHDGVESYRATTSDEFMAFRARQRTGWEIYRSTASDKFANAYLYSFRRIEERDANLRRDHPAGVPEGALYRRGESKDHNMRDNCIWLMGLSHHNKGAVLTTDLDDETIIRRRARREASPKEQTTERNLSALSREVLGMVESGHFVVERDGSRTTLVPRKPKQDESTRMAKLTDFKTPRGIERSELIRRFKEKGVNASHISEMP